ncbi:MAG: hypothetical protein MZV70_07500 [Desulfobacterales bacterium]|nr:hypothetical protein [Desulfobacterales bacterium]
MTKRADQEPQIVFGHHRVVRRQMGRRQRPAQGSGQQMEIDGDDQARRKKMPSAKSGRSECEPRRGRPGQKNPVRRG